MVNNQIGEHMHLLAPTLQCRAVARTWYLLAPSLYPHLKPMVF